MIRGAFPGWPARTPIETHPERWVRFEDIGTIAFPYRATIPTPGRAPDDGAGLAGLLAAAGIADPRPEDLKLAELMRHTRRPGIAFGTGAGLHAAAGIGTAALAARPPARRPTLPVPGGRRGRCPLFVAVEDGPGEGHRAGPVWFIRQDAVPAALSLIERRWRFGVCLVDRPLPYAPTAALCRLLPDLVAPGGFVLAAGWLDPRNGRGAGATVGVRAAFDDLVEGGPRGNRFRGAAFRFLGSYGRAGLFRRD